MSVVEREPDAARWERYYDATRERPPRRTLLAALAAFPDGFAGRAVDLGCGAGRDALPLLRTGWRVHAVDAQPGAIAALSAAAAEFPHRLTATVTRFEDSVLPQGVDLVNSSFALPLCPPERFPPMWRGIVGALRRGGRFAGQFYGERDSWAGRPGITTLTRAGAEALLDGLALELFDEEESDGVTPRGTPKHWHIFHVVARRP
jgi:SAM-dependent methyltransferase